MIYLVIKKNKNKINYKTSSFPSNGLWWIHYVILPCAILQFSLILRNFLITSTSKFKNFIDFLSVFLTILINASIYHHSQEKHKLGMLTDPAFWYGIMAMILAMIEIKKNRLVKLAIEPVKDVKETKQKSKSNLRRQLAKDFEKKADKDE